MSLLDPIFSFGPLRKLAWKLWYPFLTEKLRNENTTFLNYAFEQDPPLGIPLNSSDELNRACTQLYHHVASQVNLAGKSVIEVSCGHGGGGSYIVRTLEPDNYIGLDLNPKGIAFCKKSHAAIKNLSFIQGDAQALPFEGNSKDAVINVEASHCYPNFPGFLKEVHRVLKPGGHFLYADFRFAEKLDEWTDAINTCPLRTIQTRNISEEVLRGMDINSEKSKALVERLLPRVLQNIGRDFAAVRGSKVYESLRTGNMEYRSYCFQK